MWPHSGGAPGKWLLRPAAKTCTSCRHRSKGVPCSPEAAPSPAYLTLPLTIPHALQTYSNLADAYVQQGELAAQAGEGDLAGRCFAAALEAYETSCSMSDSGAGDDLPGLLHNWGCGLRAIAQHTQVRGGGVHGCDNIWGRLVRVLP